MDGVRDAYDRIAAHFAETRHHPWPEVEAFLDDCPPGSVGLDLGCGNARHAPPLSAVVDRVVGLDLSRALLLEARDDTDTDGLSLDLVQGDARRLPIADDAVDVAIYVAAIHHLPDRSARVASLDELARVLAPGGRALVSAWSVEHDRFDREAGFDTQLDWTLPSGETVLRFYHVYDRAEFEDELADSALVVEDCYVSSGNCYAKTSVGRISEASSDRKRSR